MLALLSLFVGVCSCGTYQNSGVDNDGIYSSNTSRRTVETVPQASNNSAYYKNYFEEKDQYSDIDDPNAVFTDIDSYEGDYADEQDSTQVAYENYGGWGQNNDNVEINIYTRPNFGFGWGRQWGGFGYWNNWNNGWGYAGFYDPFWCSPFNSFGFGNNWGPWYGNGFHRPYWNNNAYHNGYGRGLAYNTGRRSSIYNNRTNLNRRTTRTTKKIL